MLMPTVVFPVSAEAATDAMEAISAAFDSEYLIESHSIDNEEYIGIPIDMHIYFAKGKTAVPGNRPHSTPLIMYVVNTPIERIGTDSDVDIIRSMLDRGYIVAVADYKNSPLAVPPALDNSAQRVRDKLMNQGYYLTNSVFPKGSYNDCHIVPAGYNVHLNDVYWELDKHGVDGIMDEIVELWNLDFKPAIENKYINWTYTDDNGKVIRKTVTDDAVWYSDTKGTVDMENGKYTLMKYTVAKEVTDCVEMDGTPLDLNLYISFMYPANPKEKVPVMVLHNSGAYIPSAALIIEREHLVGSVFRGYAGAVYDYAYTPMMRANFVSSIGDGASYSMEQYNDKLINSAAMRYIRYKALSEPEKFKFDTDAIGVYGNSKGGHHPALGERYMREPLVGKDEAAALSEEELKETISERLVDLSSMRYLPGSSGETRYKNGEETYSEKGTTIDAGELQPWLTYNGEEITSGAQFIYCACPSNRDEVSEGHSPMFISLSLKDYWVEVNAYTNACRVFDIPSVSFDVDLGHTVAKGPDVEHGVDTYEAYFDFADYYLKGTPVKVLYTVPADNAVDVKVTDDILIKFNGPVSPDEIEKVVIEASDGTRASGKWSALYGKTEWTFAPDEELLPGDIYTVTVPGDIKGDNGAPMGSDYVYTFETVSEVETDSTFTGGKNGAYITATVPDMEALSGKNAALNTLKLRFYSSAEEAANTAEIYAVASASATSGELLGSVQLKGEGYYDFDITEYMQNKTAGEEVVFYIKQAKEAGVFERYSEDFSSGVGSNKISEAVGYELTSIGGDDAVKMWMTLDSPTVPANPFYVTKRNALSNNVLIKNSNLSDEDYGRRFDIAVKVYDTIERQLTLRTETCDASTTYMTHDTQRGYYNIRTTPGEWKTYNYKYTVYEPEYGLAGVRRQKFYIDFQPDGAKESPLYVGEIKVTETVTDIDVTDGSVVFAANGDYMYKAPSGADMPIALCDADGEIIGEYSSFKDAMNAYSYGNTVKLMKNYTFTDADAFSEFDELAAAKGDDGHIFNIDLNGYVIFSDAETKPLLWLKTTKNTIGETKINLSNGTVFLKNKALVGYDSSSGISGEKKYDVNLKDVNIITNNDFVSYNVISDTTIASGCNVTTDISLTDCLIQLKNEALENWNVKIFASGTGNLNTSYNMAGGSIKTDTLRKVSVYDIIDSVTFSANAGGVYTSLYVPESEIVPVEAYRTDSGYKTFITNSSGQGLYKYDLIVTDLTTDYGVIPEMYEDVERYPLTVFNAKGEFVVAGSDWGSGNVLQILQEAKTAGDGSVVYLRRDYEFDETGSFANLSQVNELMTIDLGGHTIDCTSGKANLFYAQAKTNHPSKIVVKNGTILTKSKPLVIFDSWATSKYTEVKDFEIAFEDIKFGFSEGASGVSGMICAVNTTADDPAANGHISLTDCTFDLVTNAPASAYTIFNMNDKNSIIPVKTTVTGGKIIADSLENATLADVNGSNGSGITFAKDSNGEYTKLYVKQPDTLFPDILKTDSGSNKTFAKTENVDENGYTECILDGAIIMTQYGAVSPEYAEKTFVAFSGGTAVFAHDDFYGENSTGIINLAKEYIKGNKPNPDGSIAAGATEVQIVMMKDYTMANANYVNLSQVKGKITIDLNGHTFTQANKKPIFNAQAKPWSTNGVFDSHIVMKNGNVVINNSNLIIYQTYSTGSISKRFIFDFEDISFTFASSATVSELVAYSTGDKKTLPSVYDISFSDCTFDVSKTSKSITLFGANHAANSDIKLNYKVSGGNIKAKKLSDIIMDSFNSSNATIEYLQSEESGIYMSITLPSSEPVPDVSLTGVGELVYVKAAVNSDGSITYAPGTATKYGMIPASEAKRNFAVFSDGEFLGAYDELYSNTATTEGSLKGKGAFDAIKNHVINTKKDAQILMLRDAVMSTEKVGYGNIAQFKGQLIIDLGGNTLTQFGEDTIFTAAAKPWSTNGVFDTSITVTNGNILLDKGYLIKYSTWDGSNDQTDSHPGAVKNMDFTFDNIAFSFKQGFNKSSLVADGGLSHQDPLAATFDINYTNCNFDMSNLTGNVALCVTDHPKTQNSMPLKVDVNYKVTGSDIIKKTADDFAIASLESGGSVEYVKGDNGEYITLTLPAGVESPDIMVNINGTYMNYAKAFDSDGYVTYKPVPLTAHQILEYDADNKAAKLAIVKDGTYVVVFARYDGDALAQVNAVTKTFSTGTHTVEQTIDFTADKVMLWQDTENMVPLAVAAEKKPEIKVLAIGNSFSIDSVAYLYQIAENADIDVKIGNLYIGGCSLERHCNNALNNISDYEYYKNTTGSFVKTKGVSIYEALTEEEWDIIVLQQVSGKSGQADTYEPYITQLKDYINQNKTNTKAVFAWNMTWAYQSDSKHSDFPTYNSNQLTMYNAIINAVKDEIVTDNDFEYVIPVGTAIQNVRTSYIGDTLTRDGYHLSYQTGRYIAGLTWFKALTGQSIDGIRYTPDGMSAYELETIKEAVNNACEKPFEITNSSYTDAV